MAVLFISVRAAYGWAPMPWYWVAGTDMKEFIRIGVATLFVTTEGIVLIRAVVGNHGVKSAARGKTKKTRARAERAPS